MVYCVCEREGFFSLTDENGKTVVYKTVDFMQKVLRELMKENNVVYMYSLSFWGLGIVDRLRKFGMVDYTENRLNDQSQRRPEKGCYVYSVGAENGSFYKITATMEGTLKILPFELLAPLDDKLLMDFDGKKRANG